MSDATPERQESEMHPSPDTTVSGSDAGRQDEQPQDHRALSTTQAVQGSDAAGVQESRPVTAHEDVFLRRAALRSAKVVSAGVMADATPKCPKCGGARWLWWNELDQYDGPALQAGVDDTRYPCDACGVALPNDAARLDWLAHREHSFEFCVPGDHVAKKAWLLSVETGQIDRQGKFYDEFDGDTLREAIDAAMKVNAGAQEPRLGWCEHCGEGVTTFCRGALDPCPKGLTQTDAATPGATT